MFIILSHTHDIIVFVTRSKVTFCLVNYTSSFVCTYILVLIVSLNFITQTHMQDRHFCGGINILETRVFLFKHQRTYPPPPQRIHRIEKRKKTPKSVSGTVYDIWNVFRFSFSLATYVLHSRLYRYFGKFFMFSVSSLFAVGVEGSTKVFLCSSLSFSTVLAKAKVFCSPIAG